LIQKTNSFERAEGLIAFTTAQQEAHSDDAQPTHTALSGQFRCRDLLISAGSATGSFQRAAVTSHSAGFLLLTTAP
jgi:hypothetical protein